MEENSVKLPKKENAIFTFSTHYSKPIMEDYLLYGRYNAIKVGIVVLAVAAFMVTFGILYGPLLIYLGGVVFLLDVLILWAVFHGERNVRKNFDTILGSRFDYYMYDEFFYVESVAPNGTGHLIIQYKDMVDFHETDLVLFARLKNNQVYIFEKEKLQEIEKYDMFRRILLNNAKTYRGVKINRKKDSVEYEYLSKQDRKRTKRRSKSQVEMLVTLLFVPSFLTFIIFSMMYMGGISDVALFALTLFIHIIILVCLVMLKVKYKQVKSHTLYIVLVSLFIATTLFAFWVVQYF